MTPPYFPGPTLAQSTPKTNTCTPPRHQNRHGHAAIASAAAGASGLDWTSSAPKQQSFSLTATVTCVEIKEVHGGEVRSCFVFALCLLL